MLDAVAHGRVEETLNPPARISPFGLRNASRPIPTTSEWSHDSLGAKFDGTSRPEPTPPDRTADRYPPPIGLTPVPTRDWGPHRRRRTPTRPCLRISRSMVHRGHRRPLDQDMH